MKKARIWSVTKLLVRLTNLFSPVFIPLSPGCRHSHRSYTIEYGKESPRFLAREQKKKENYKKMKILVKLNKGRTWENYPLTLYLISWVHLWNSHEWIRLILRTVTKISEKSLGAPTEGQIQIELQIL